MAHVTALAQHILTLGPDKDAARLSFYHYLKNLCDALEPVNSDLINRFFYRVLTFQHWQENKAELWQETMGLLGHYQDTLGQPLPLAGVLRAEDLQVVQAESLKTLEIVVTKYLEKTGSPYDQFRVLREGDDRVIVPVLQGDRSLRVTAYSKALAIRGGELTPLCHEMQVIYTPDLQLHPMLPHQLDIGPHTSARFRSGPEGITGAILRGYTFQKFGSMEGGSLHRHPVLFYPLKRLEQFFVNRKSDPMYIELTGLLEKALELVGDGQHLDPQQETSRQEVMKFAEAALERGRLAMEHIFPDDKLVRLLIDNLGKTLALLGSLRARMETSPQAAPEFGPEVLATPTGIDFVESSLGFDKRVETDALKGAFEAPEDREIPWSGQTKSPAPPN